MNSTGEGVVRKGSTPSSRLALTNHNDHCRWKCVVILCTMSLRRSGRSRRGLEMLPSKGDPGSRVDRVRARALLADHLHYLELDNSSALSSLPYAISSRNESLPSIRQYLRVDPGRTANALSVALTAERISWQCCTTKSCAGS
jgi:hypothetical protein